MHAPRTQGRYADAHEKISSSYKDEIEGINNLFDQLGKNQIASLSEQVAYIKMSRLLLGA